MTNRIVTYAVLAVAVIIGLTAAFWPQREASFIATIYQIFTLMLPILATGAILKYLMQPKHQCCDNCSHCNHCEPQSKA